MVLVKSLKFLLPICIAIQSLCCNKCLAQHKWEIYWGRYGYTLRANDFKGVGDKQFENGAVSNLLLQPNYDMENDTVRIRVLNIFHKNYSYIAEKRFQNDTVLLHEQGHFDINEIYARILRKKITLFKFSRSAYGQELKALFDTIQIPLNKEQDRYELGTLYGNYYNPNVSWNKHTHEVLDTLKSYHDVTYQFVLDKSFKYWVFSGQRENYTERLENVLKNKQDD